MSDYSRPNRHTLEFEASARFFGTVGDAVLASESDSYLIERTSVVNANGSTTTTLLARNADGSLAFRNIITSTADGLHKTTQYDDDGNGSIDRSQTDDLVVNANGSRTRTLANFNADGSLAGRRVRCMARRFGSLTPGPVYAVAC